MPNIINLCCLGHSDHSVAGVFDDTIHSVASLLRLAGFSPIISRNNIVPDATNILWGAGAHHSPPLASILEHCNSSNTLIFNMEQLESDSVLVTQEYLEFLTHFRVLDYSVHNIRALRRSYPLTRAEEFPLLPAAHFAYDHFSGAREKLYHFAFFGAMNERREKIIEGLRSHDLRIKVIAGHYGANLSRELVDCMAVLNIHAYDSMVFESARVLRPIAMGLPVISESSKLPQLVNWELAPVKFAPIEELIRCCIEVVSSGYKEFDQAGPEFLNYYHRNPALLKSVQRLVLLDR